MVFAGKWFENHRSSAHGTKNVLILTKINWFRNILGDFFHGSKQTKDAY
jgi:hypothetical protein